MFDYDNSAPYPQQPASCHVCCNKAVRYDGDVCSRRCGWILQGLCPQCGRTRHPYSLFCCNPCAAESVHANWCAYCGVRQLCHGMPHCGFPACGDAYAYAMHPPAAQHHHHHHVQQHQHDSSASSSSSSSYYPMPSLKAPTTTTTSSHQLQQQPTNAPPPVSARARAAIPSVRMQTDDKQLGAFRNQLTSAACDLRGAVKVGGSQEVRKRYLATRNRLETELNEICGHGAPKHGHGGEGNEHRRFVRLNCDCGLRSLDQRHCGSSSCDVCHVLDASSVRRDVLNRVSLDTYATVKDAMAAVANAAADAPAASNAFTGIVACRVAVGLPVVASPEDMELHYATYVPSGYHTIAVNEFGVESIRVFDDSAIDALFLMVVAPHGPASTGSYHQSNVATINAVRQHSNGKSQYHQQQPQQQYHRSASHHLHQQQSSGSYDGAYEGHSEGYHYQQ